MSEEIYTIGSKWDESNKFPNKNEIVLGFDEQLKTWKQVRYCNESNRFFDQRNSVFPKTRMRSWKRIKEKEDE